MTSVGLDTSLIVRLLIGEPEEQVRAVWTLVQSESDAGRPPLVADLVVAESYFVLMHHYSIPALQAVTALAALLADERLVGESAAELLAEPLSDRSALDFDDLLIHRHYSHAGRTFATFDKRAARLRGAHLVK